LVFVTEFVRKTRGEKKTPNRTCKRRYENNVVARRWRFEEKLDESHFRAPFRWLAVLHDGRLRTRVRASTHQEHEGAKWAIVYHGKK